MIIFEAVMCVLCWGFIIAIITCEETYCYFRKMWLDVRLFAVLTALAIYVKFENWTMLTKKKDDNIKVTLDKNFFKTFSIKSDSYLKRQRRKGYDRDN